MKISLLDEIREKNPVVLNISNFVTVQDVANGINAIGASPIMSEEIAETDEMVGISSAVALNLGAFSKPQVDHILAMGQAANAQHRPLVLDPVAVGAISYRKQVAADLMRQFQVDVIRGNAGEIAALAEVAWDAKGIDAGSGNADLAEIAKACAKKQHAVVILSGETDYITDGERVVRVQNGTPLFQLHVGSGDMLSSIVGAFCAVSDGDYFEAAQTACLVFAATGEIVANQLGEERPGTFAAQLMDALHLVSVADIEKIAKFD
ncbi:hydroxyethylthiazole kinase [Secundilactobacillus paracollinoides]|uniref:hydroxyethylthiazole kinase n=1 Tax=Secundilactobacillus paracollinoides TaxID=240427 RepID=UPI0006D16913|nr:hydroxyethylthiazole kinase [Secundilactobacillus paracollinoides]ANZ62734.1 hydroxyethylthiazole kinase [Secundilactobacillus paracollinoides]KRL79096.1 hydroxyethylthiazole kinase [Secundilactobacillus paracollinoides DSM 15502 = JCM 11969]